MKIFKYFSAFFVVLLLSTSFVSAETQDLSPLQRISLKFYCFTAPLFGQDTSRCDQKLQESPSLDISKNINETSSGKTQTNLSSVNSENTESSPQGVSPLVETKTVTERIIEQPIYITRYVSTPGPKGEKGDKGDPGTMGGTLASTNPLSNNFSSNTYAGA